MRHTIRVTICNQKGLHARATAKFVKTAEHFNARVEVRRTDSQDSEPDGEDAERACPVSGRSLLGLMMLGADRGTELEISAEGEDAELALGSLRELVEQRFGEEE